MATKHLFEIIQENLNHLTKEQNDIFFQLLTKPREASESLIQKYIPLELANLFIQSKNFNKNIEINFSNKEFTDAFIKKLKYIYSINDAINEKNVLFYTNRDIMLCYLSGLVDIDENNNFTLKKDIMDSFNIYIFSRFFALESHYTDRFLASSLIQNLKRKEKNKLSDFRRFVFFILDKYFCLNIRYINKRVSKAKRMYIKGEFICFIWLFLFKNYAINCNLNKKNIISFNTLNEFGFSKHICMKLCKEISTTPNEQFINLVSEGLEINDMNLKYALQLNFKNLFTDMSFFGDWFESDYILKYLQNEIDKKRFYAVKGFKAGTTDKNKYDSDIILYDKDLELFYFIQIKHRTTVLHEDFKSRYSEYTKNSQINHGIEQLNSLRKEIIECPSRIKSKMLTTFGKKYKKIIEETDLREKGRFLLIHNIEDLDMCTKNNIAMYEWNTFKNMLHGWIYNLQKIDKNQSKIKLLKNKYNNKWDFSQIENSKNIQTSQNYNCIIQNFYTIIHFNIRYKICILNRNRNLNFHWILVTL